MSTKKYYTESYEKYYQEFSGTNVNESATNFNSEVEYLSREFQNVQNVITNWSGEGAQAMSSAALQSVLDKFNTAKKNIDTALLPATEAVEELKKDLETLKLQEETLRELQEQLKIERVKVSLKKF